MLSLQGYGKGVAAARAVRNESVNGKKGRKSGLRSGTVPLAAAFAFLVALAVLCFASGVSEEGSAVPYDDGTLCYELDDSTRTATVTGHVTGTGTELDIPGSVEYDGNTYVVTTIGRSAFDYYSSLTGPLTIPNSVTVIYDFAFSGCSGLTGSLTIPNSVVRINWMAFEGCSNFEEIEFLGSSLPYIEAEAFWLFYGNGTPKIYPVKAPSDPTFSGRFLDRYGGYGTVFDYGHTVTVEMYDPNAGTVSGGGTYYYGDEITLDVSLNPGYTFVQWNDGVTDNPRTFTKEILEHVTYTAYTSCSSFEWNDGTLRYVMDDSTFTATVVGHATGTGTELNIPGSVHYGWQTYTVTAIGDYAFWGCSSLTGPLTIPNTVTYIGRGAFNGCSGFTGDLAIPDSVTTIGDLVFSRCSGFNGALTIPGSVTSIGDGAFWGCSSLTGPLTIPGSVTSIGWEAFFGCSSFDGLTIPADVTDIGEMTFAGCSGFNGALTIPGSVTSISIGAFDGCSGFDSLTIPDSVTNIGSYAFSGCSGFTGPLAIPGSVTNIGCYAFSGCSGFTGPLAIPGSVTYIENRAFWWCCGFEEIEFRGSSLPFIEAEAFWLNPGDPPKTYPVKVPSGAAFSGRFLDEFGGPGTVFSYGHTVTVLIDNPEAGTVSGGGTYNYGDEITLSVNLNHGYGFVQWNDGITDNPRTLTEEDLMGATDLTFTAITEELTVFEWNDGTLRYQLNRSGYTATVTGHMTGTGTELNIPGSVHYGWQTYTVTAIGDYAFYYSGITGPLTIPNSVTYIGWKTFFGCSELTGPLTIPNSVTTINNYAFEGCSGFTGPLTLPDCIGSINYSTFHSCSGLTGNLTIPDSVTHIGRHAFYNCSGFTGPLTIPDSVRVIYFRAFHGCSNFEEIEFRGSSLPRIESSEAFWLNVGNSPKVYPVKVPSNQTYPDGFLDEHGGPGTVFDYGHTVTVLIDDPEAGTVSGGGKYYYGDEITLTAHTNTGYAFVQWNDGVTDNPRIFTKEILEHVTYTAYTMRTVYSITYHLDGGTNDPSNPAAYETTSPTVTFAAPVKDGYAFKGWYTDPGFAEGYEITEIPSGSTGDVEVYAKFVERLQIAVDDMLDEVYAGFAIEPAVTVRSGGAPIAQDGNYTVSYEDNVNCGTGKATVEGIGDYIGTVVKEFAINPRELTVTTESATKTYDGTVLTASGNVYGFVNWETCTFNVTGSQTCAGSSANTYTLVFDGTAMESNYYVTESLGTLTVDMRALTVNADDKSVTFPGPAPVYTATYGGFADGEDEGDLGGVLTFACGYDGTAYQAAFPITPGGLVSDNYDILYVDGTLTVNRGTAAVPSAFSGLVYDGTERIGVPEGTGYVLADHRKTDAGSYAATATLADGYQWTDGDTGDRIIDWSIAGRELTVTTESATKVYDGTVLTAPGNVCGLVDGETCTFNVTGSQTCAGSSANTYTLVFDGTAVESNYCVMENLGTLTVTRAGLVKPTADTTVFVYDGSEQTYSPVGFDPSTMGIDGNKRTDAGSQTVAVSIADDANFVWADGTEDDVTFAFVIGTKALPVPEGIPSVTYNGNRQVPTVVVRDGSETLAEGTDYEVSWDDTGFTDAKTYTATVTGTGNYHGEETVTYVITQDSPWPDPLQWIFDRIIAILKAILRMFGWW